MVIWQHFERPLGVLTVVFDLVGVLGVDSAPAQGLVGPGKQRKPPLIKMVQILAEGLSAKAGVGSSQVCLK